MAVLTGREKINIFLAVLGPEISAKILRYLPEEMAALVASGVGKIAPSREDVRMVLRDFGRLFLSSGGPVSSLTPGESGEGAPVSFEDLARTIRPRQLFGWLVKERIQTAAFILAGFKQLPAVETLALFSPEARSKIEVAMEKLRPLEFSNGLREPIQKVLLKNLEQEKHGAH